MTVTASQTVDLVPTAFAPAYEQGFCHSVFILDGLPYLPVRWTVNHNAHGATDDATVTLPISPNPDFTLQLFRAQVEARDRALVSGTGGALVPAASATPVQRAAVSPNLPVYAEIWAGYRDTAEPTTDQSGLSRRFLGIVDLYTAHFDANEVTFNCRSLAAPLVDQQISSAPLNMTSLQFAKAMADAVGLTANLALNDGVTPITLQQMLGREFIGGFNFNATVYKMRPWDILLQCALFDDADVWVDQAVLNYVSPNRVKRNRITITYGGGGGDDIGFASPVGVHAPQFNRNIRVEVRSYTKKTRQATIARADSDELGGIKLSVVSKTVTSSPVFGTSSVVSQSVSSTGSVSWSTSTNSGGAASSVTRPGSEAGKEIYKVFRPNLTPKQCNDLAKSLWRQYSQHQFQLSFDLPVTRARAADFAITSLLDVRGLQYNEFNTHGKDDQYYPRQITETFDPRSEGWKWSVKAINAVLPAGAV